VEHTPKKSYDLIREVLLKTVSKHKNIYSYYSAIQEARELLGVSRICEINFCSQKAELRLLAEC